jgi:tetratricopeptide (TPR) repeat protein
MDVLFCVRRRLPVLMLGALVLGLAPRSVLAAGQPAPGSRVLVMPFSAEVDPEAPGGAGAALWLGEAASVLISDELTALGVGALPRDVRVAAFDRLGLPMSPTLMRATVIRVGELIGASEIVFGEVKLGSRLSVRAHLISLGSGRQLPDVADDGALEEIFPLFHQVSVVLARETGHPLADASAAPPALPFETFENYVKGLVAATPATQQRFLETAMTQAPDDARILTALWAVYTSQGAYEKALAVASAVRPESPDARKARLAAALSLIELKRYDGAFAELKALHAEEPSGPVSNALGVVQLRRGAPAGSGTPASYFARAAEESPGNTDYLFNLGYASALASDVPSALFWLRETVRYDAANGDAHLVMSAALAASGRRAEAQRELDLARLLGARADSNGTLTTVVPPGLERLSQEVDEWPAVDAAIGNPAERDQREVAAFHRDAGRRLVAAGRDREAMDELRRAIYLAPYEDEPHLLLGRLYRRGGRLGEAIDEFKVALWCRETAAGRVALGAALLENGDRDAARREAERALALDPGSVEAAALLKRIGGEGVLTS